jgi:hypothetical protein
VASRPLASTSTHPARYLERPAMSQRKASSGVRLRLLSLSLGLGIAFLSSVSLVDAAEAPTRPEYVEQAEPICKQNTISNRNALKGTRDDVRHGRLDQAARKFDKAAREFGRTVQRLEALPRPTADEEILTRWFTHLSQETALLKNFAKRLHKHNTVDLADYVLELRHHANVTNNIVLTFGFDYCLIQTARYL